jgi:sulfate adenylyltransferase
MDHRRARVAVRGVCIWLTGLSGAGKTTTADVLVPMLEAEGRTVTFLDGDRVRQHLSAGLGFSKEDRDTNVRRVGYVASEVVRHGGTVVCALVSPYRGARADARELVGADAFVEVFVDTPLAVCESRDTKGLYARARTGEIPSFTGVSDPFEPPEAPDLRLDTQSCGPDENARRIIDHLVERGLLPTAVRLA